MSRFRMVHLRCPQCATVIDVAEGVSPVCPTCGYGRTAMPGGPPIAYTGAPTGQPPPYGYPQPDPPYAPGQPGAPGYPVAAATSGKAIGSLVAGIVGVFANVLGIILGGVAVGLGLHAQREIDASAGRLTGKGIATAGIVVGVVAMVIGFFVLFIFLLLFSSAEWRYA